MTVNRTTGTDTTGTGPSGRTILLEANISRTDVAEAVARVVAVCTAEGVAIRMLETTSQVVAAASATATTLPIDTVPDSADAADGCELVLVLGGDGTFLRASEYARNADVPVLGVNLGRIGFLAESEVTTLDDAVRRVVHGDYRVEGRMTVDVTVLRDDEVLGTGWALNEMSLEKASGNGVLEASVEIDGRPVSDYGCDGVLVSTPTGSTAYAFSAGGPILWPELDALLVVPNNAHALFARPLVVAPSSLVAVETERGTGDAVAVLDGRRTIELPAGSRVEVARGHRDVRWVRIDDAPFTDRLVRKFRLPVTGWRGRAVGRG